MNEREKRHQINADLMKLIRLVEERERTAFMLTATGQLVNDLVGLANAQKQKITALEAKVATLTPTPEDLAAEAAAKDLLAANPVVPPAAP